MSKGQHKRIKQKYKENGTNEYDKSIKITKKTISISWNIIDSLINDSHYKVQCKAQGVFNILLKHYSSLRNPTFQEMILDKTLEKLLLKTLNNLTDKRKDVNEWAMEAIETCKRVFSQDYLWLRALNILDTKNTRTQIATFEFLASIIKDTDNFTTVSSNVKKCIKKWIFYCHHNSKDTNFIGPILSIILCLRDMNFNDTMKILTSGALNFAEIETFDNICVKYAPDLVTNMTEYKKKEIIKMPISIDREKYSRSIDNLPNEALNNLSSMKSENLSGSVKFDDITNFTSGGYCNIYLKDRVEKLKKIAMNHTMPTSPNPKNFVNCVNSVGSKVKSNQKFAFEKTVDTKDANNINLNTSHNISFKPIENSLLKQRLNYKSKITAMRSKEHSIDRDMDNNEISKFYYTV